LCIPSTTGRWGEFKTWVFGACNNPNEIADAVRSRFLKVTFQPYTEEQFREVLLWQF